MMLALLMILLLQIRAGQNEVIKDPALKPFPNFSAENDAKGIVNGDRIQIAGIICRRTVDQRKKIQDYYNKNNFGSTSSFSLLGTIKHASTDSLAALYDLVFDPPEVILAKSIHTNISNNKYPEVGAIEEVVCANEKEMKNLIDKEYQTRFNKTVESELASFRADDKAYQDVMLKYCWKGLCQEKKMTEQDAGKEAQTLRSIDPKKKKTDFKNKLIELLNKYCEPDLKLIFQKYRQGDYGIEDAAKEAFKVKRERRAYFYLVRYIEDLCKLYAFELQHAADDGTDIHTDKINRIILSRCERDLFCIMKAYHDKGYATFTSRLSRKMIIQNWLGNGTREKTYTECIRYLMGKH